MGIPLGQAQNFLPPGDVIFWASFSTQNTVALTDNKDSTQ